jgi:hypothetical protein
MNLVNKKLQLASKAVDQATLLMDALQKLKELKEEYAGIGTNFEDSDFIPLEPPNFRPSVAAGLVHLDAYTIGALLSNVVPAIDAVVTDAGNGNFNENILFKVRR